MRYLIFRDDLHSMVVWIVLALLFCAAGLLIRAPKMLRSWPRTIVRSLGSVLLIIVAITFVFLAFFAIHEPREHFGFISETGSGVALLSHSSLRDSSATQVTVKGDSCCIRYIAYNYYGDGDDGMGSSSVRWIDDHHLAIRYFLDPTGVQLCRPQVGDIQVLCEPQPAARFDSKSKK